MCIRLFLLVCGLIFQAASQVPSTYFVNPPVPGPELFFLENNVYSINFETRLQWVTNLTSYSIFLWQQSLDVSFSAKGAAIYTKILGSAEEGEFVWTVTSQQFGLAQSPVFFLALSPSDAEALEGASTSHYFNITTTNVTVSVSTPPTSVSGTRAANATGSVPTQSQTSSPSPASPQSSQTDSSSSGASPNALSVGLGLGLGLSIPLLLLSIYIVNRRRVKLRRPLNSATDGQTRTRTSLFRRSTNFIGELPGQNYRLTADGKDINYPTGKGAVELQ